MVENSEDDLLFYKMSTEAKFLAVFGFSLLI